MKKDDVKKLIERYEYVLSKIAILAKMSNIEIGDKITLGVERTSDGMIPPKMCRFDFSDYMGIPSNDLPAILEVFKVRAESERKKIKAELEAMGIF